MITTSNYFLLKKRLTFKKAEKSFFFVENRFISHDFLKIKTKNHDESSFFDKQHKQHNSYFSKKILEIEEKILKSSCI